MESLEGRIDILICNKHMCGVPTEYECREGLVLYKPPFDTGFIVCDNLNTLEGVQETAKITKVVREIKASSCKRIILFMLYEFITGEELGTELPWICLACKNCKEIWVIFHSKKSRI
jgi:hypothetical protein